jgi:hypothetical protein
MEVRKITLKLVFFLSLSFERISKSKIIFCILFLLLFFFYKIAWGIKKWTNVETGTCTEESFNDIKTVQLFKT